MFAPDVLNLRQFYATPFGEGVRSLITDSLYELWPQAKGDVVLGMGYATPYLGPYLDQATPVMLCMPARQGASYWPHHAQGNVVFLAHESELPLQENSVNRILLLHSIENSEQLSGMMDEIWRVLTPGGRVLAIVPNRMGAWARSSRSPFGYGRPFSLAQLRHLMSEHHLTPTRSASALFIPPTRIRLLWRIAKKIEWLGKWVFPFFGGVLFIEGEKQVYASIKQPASVRKAYRIPMPAANPVLGRR